MTYDKTQIIVSPKPPFEIQAIAYEQDTALVLGATEIKEPSETTTELINQAKKIPDKIPGSVLVKEDSPIQFLAIVHDLDQKPTWTEEWVIKALEGILRESEQRFLHAIATQPLGAVHGTLTQQRFLVLLRSLIGQTVYLKRIWVMEIGESIV